MNLSLIGIHFALGGEPEKVCVHRRIEGRKSFEISLVKTGLFGKSLRMFIPRIVNIVNFLREAQDKKKRYSKGGEGKEGERR